MNIPSVIAATNLSTAWCDTLQHVTDHPGTTEITPLVLTITQFDESESVRKVIDADLKSRGKDSVETVASTIFPAALYTMYQSDRNKFYERYQRILPRIKRMDSRNANGTYFERLIAFGETKKINQLDIIITALRGETNIRRRSKLQASVFDPLRDHKDGVFQGFPCLQHVTFYKSQTGGLILNSFYAVQYLYQRAYGNWLGLINLGKFVAKEANMELERFNCFVGVATLDRITKTDAKGLLEKIALQSN